jgi:segregation and condensation protein B
MSLKAKLEAIIYAAETPVTLDQLIELVKESVISEGAADGTEVKSRVRLALEELVVDYYAPDHGTEIRQVAGGYRMSTKPEHHDVVRAFAKSLKPPIRLSLPALETLAVIAYKQPVTVPEISEIRGVDSSGVIATLLDRKLITTAGRKAVIGRPILYKTTKEFLMRFGLKDVGELPSMEEFEKLVAESFQSDLLPAESEQADATGGLGSELTETVSSEESAVQHQDPEPAHTTEDSELATVEKHHSGESDPAA